MLIAITFGNFLQYLPAQAFAIPEAHAADEEEVPNDQLGLIAILVEESLMQDFDMKSRIMTYAENAQSRTPHSKALVLEVSKDESTFKIASALEKLYFEGVDTDLIDGNPLNNDTKFEDDNQLVGVIMIGDIPLPVVHEENGSYVPSVYPYTDFYQKAYIYDYQTDQFEKNKQAQDQTPEVWHGLIVPPSKAPEEAKKELMAYFDKNNDYTQGKNGFDDFEQRMLYANFPEMEKQMNRVDYGNYKRYIDFMEEMVFKRFNKHLLKAFVAQVSADLESDTPILDEASLNQMYDIYTENIFQQYALPLLESLKTYRGGLNEVVEKTGRWGAAEVDSPESLITLRDEYAKHQLHRSQLLLEKEVDDFIKQSIPLPKRELKVVTAAKLNVKLKVLKVVVDNRFFDFFSRIDGISMSTVTNTSQCGIQVGQQRDKNASPLEDNSVLVNANRLYNPETLVVPPDKPPKDWKVENTDTYKQYAGCVFNNSISNAAKCIAKEAEQSLFDIEGSLEVKAGEPVYTDDKRCAVERMSFFLPKEVPFNSVAAESQGIQIPLDQVINSAYVGLQGNLQNPSLQQKANFVTQKLLAKEEPFTYDTGLGADIELSAVAQEKPIDSIYAHVEPKNETIQAIKHIGEPRVDPKTGELNFPQIITPSLPADGTRLVSFMKEGALEVFEYMNLFRIKGDNAEQITENLLKKMTEKQAELSLKTDTNTDLFETFFVKNNTLLEPLNWKAESLDQKLTTIIPKYIDRDSFMPTPLNDPQKSPQNQPEGYEVLQIVAHGDAQGYEFGINRAMQTQSQTFKAQQKKDEEALKKKQEEEQKKQDEKKPKLPQGNYVCGDPKGVEVWEWFGAMQCWIEDEVMPKQDVFALSQMCSAAPLPPKEEPIKDGTIFDLLLAKAGSFKVDLQRNTMVVGQEQTITISAFNTAGEPLLGYIDMPIHLELSDPSMGEFGSNDVYIFTGKSEVKFTPKKASVTELTVKMGDLPPQKIQLTILDEMNLQWAGAEEKVDGKSQFTLNVTAVDKNNKTLIGVNDEIVLSPEQPADGAFEANGKVKLTKGTGQIKFIPAPGKATVTLLSKDPYLKSKPFIITPSKPSATHIILNSSKTYMPIGEAAEIQVTVADEFGFPVTNFNGEVKLKLSEATQTFATLPLSSIKIEKGLGLATVQAGKDTADITLEASHPELSSTSLSLPLLARVDTEQWKKMYPQTLFASFVGFPAGDITQEDYFGGTHLMSGKTEAVYSFLTAPHPETKLDIDANHLIHLTEASQSVLVDFSENNLLLQAFDQKAVQTLFSKKKTLNFEAVEPLPKENLEVGTLYVQGLDNNYALLKKENGYELVSSQNKKIVEVQKDKITLLDSNFKWQYVNEPEFGAVEVQLTDGLITPLRLVLNFKPENLNIQDFVEVNPNLKWTKNLGGKSLKDASGFSFYESTAQVPEEERDEFYGLEGDHQYISLFASGVNIGEAVKYNLPTTGILLGDPTIKLKTKSNTGLNYNEAIGEKIYQDPKGAQVASINHFNFNNDNDEDAAVLLSDGRVRLLEGGSTTPPYKDRGDLAFLADGGIALESLDLKKDGYEDLLVATKEGRLAILNNDKEVMTRTEQKLDVGKQIRKLILEDMDQDGSKDLVILDSRGDIYIFYYDSKAKKFPEKGKWIGNYGFSLKLEQNLNTDLDIRYAGLPEPQGLTDDKGNQAQVPLDQFEGGGKVDDQKALDFYKKLQDESNALAKDPYATQSTQVPKLPWSEGSEAETYFAPIESIGTLGVAKKVSNKDRPGEKNVDLEETLTYQIEINSAANLNGVVLADVLPDALVFDPKSVTCVEGGCEGIQAQQNSVLLFFSNLKLVAGQKTILSYEAKIDHTPEADIFVQTVEEPNENLKNPNSILDAYKDILVSPPYNNTGKVLIHYTTAARTYSVIQSNEPKPTAPNKEVGGFGEIMKQMEGLNKGEYDPENPPKVKMTGMEGALDEATGNNDCFEDPGNPEACVGQVLDRVGEKLKDLGCIGGGCWPMPYNQAFFVPPDMAFPAFAFPTTLPTTAGPMPFVWPDSFMGASNVPGPISSVMRFYVSPTLTGGIGMAACWGPYPTSPTVPPPVFPIPYPPPVGNCMVRVIPAEDLYGGLCSEIADGMDKLMNLLSSGVSKIQSSINSVNNDPNVPLNVQPVGQNQAAGGLEVSLAVNLGKAQKFDPPLKTFSNIHLKGFDSIGGVIANWVDRQMMEIQNKLLTLPTVSIYLPDTKSLITADFEKTQKRFTGWLKTMDGSAAATLNSLSNIGNQNAKAPANDTESKPTLGEALRGGLQNVSGSQALKYKNAIETQASIYNLNSLEGLYDVASTLPLVKLTEKPIEFRVPWLSAGEIQSYILELQNWIIYYEQEYDRVKDKWEALKCDNLPDANNAKSYAQNALNCSGRKLADAFGANFDDIIASAKKNIEVLQSYLAFPKQLAAYKQQLAGYVGSVACYLDVIANMMGGYMAEIKQQMVAWAETILTIKEVIKNIKELFNVFTNFESNCETCTNERFGNFGWWSLLGLVLPDIPVIQFPKIPDIVLDLSNIDIMLDIELPVLNIRPEPIPLPPLPYISLPDFPNASIFLQLPPLPILPAPPKLPPLPDLPPLPTLDLPTLPPPPKLPDVGKAFRVIIPLIEKILQTWCLVKKSLAPVPEMALQNQISLLTARPAYLIPLDLLQVQAPKIALFDVGFNQVRIETIIYLGLKLNAPTKALEELSQTWNTWIDEIPEAMNKAYQIYLDADEKIIQGALDDAENFMQGSAQKFEAAFDKYVQDWLDKKVGDPLEEADKWAKNQEKEWQTQADKMGVTISYEQYYNQINQLYEKVRTLKNDKVNAFFDDKREIIQGLNYLMPSVKVFEILADDQFDAYQQEMLDLTSEKLNQLGSYGPSLLPRLYACLRYYKDCRVNQEKYFGPNINLSQEEIKSVIPETDSLQPLASVPTSNAGLVDNSEEQYAKKLLETTEGKEIAGLFGQITQAIDEVNRAEQVDYTVLKDQFGVPDYEMSARPTTVDKLKRMEKDLTAHSEKLYAEAESLKQITDLNAISGVLPRENLPFQLASQEDISVETEGRVMTNAIEMPTLIAKNEIQPLEEKLVELQKKINQEYKGDVELNPVENTTGCKADLCLPDPITKKPVPVVPSIELLPKSETLFMPNGHLIYSDGTGLYLKRDLTVNEVDKNTDTGKPQRFTLGELAEKMKMEESPKASVNMLQTQFAENGAATFNWLTPTHPDLYGYGFELEKIINGFDANKQSNPTADVKIVLLPPDENGKAPEVFVGDKKVEYGTLITSLKASDEAQKRFGVEANTTVLRASEVHFPTLNNVQINVSDRTAVYFDQLQGSGYTLQMENGFYQIKMTWFDKNAKTATYSENEVLAPQRAAGGGEPLLINPADRYYVPLYKEKRIKATDIYADLSGTYNYYWLIGDSKKLEMGGQLEIPPQKELTSMKVKLIASQDIDDPSATQFEKEFTVEIYAPEINLNQEKLNEGVVAGQMSPRKDQTDELDGIPFTVFRNRGGSWKNIGILHAADKTKTPTVPPLNDTEGKKYTYANSYYSAGQEGGYEIKGFDVLDPSPMLIKDQQGNKVAEVMPGTGKINFFVENKYELKAFPATETTPTRIAILLKTTQEVIGNIYYLAEADKEPTLVKTELVYPNVAKAGVTVGDVDPKDDVVAQLIPKNAPSFPGGVAIFNAKTEKNIALVDKDGSLRLMDSAYDLTLKNKTSAQDPYIFRIVELKNQTALADVFIQANWNHLEVDGKTQMNALSQQDLKKSDEKIKNLPKIPNQSQLGGGENSNPLLSSKPKLPSSPFPDVPATHPYFKEIMELYNSDVVRGFEDQSFRPDQPLTRAEFIKIALGVTNCFDCQKATTPQIARYLTNPFPDVAMPLWYFYCVWVAKELKMITGYGDGQFRPTQNISRAEAAAILLRQSEVDFSQAPQTKFKDVVPYAWYVKPVQMAVQMGLIKEKGGLIKPDEAITRGEFAFMATALKNYRQCRLIDEDGDGNFDWWEMTHDLDPLRKDDQNACACRDNPNQNDTDKDGVRDVCDLDIDGDGTLNPMCIFDEKGAFSQTLAETKAKDLGEKEKVDNCIFKPNAEQTDYDNNGVGDGCESCACSDNPNQKDTDGDGTKDVCDTDIDNDKKMNPICMFDEKGLLDKKKAAVTGDNCIFSPNEGQEDQNKDGVGDACESGDLCPGLPEDEDGVEDQDGCPELTDEFKLKEAGIYASPGPLCGLIDFKSDFMPGDIFMTAITDTETHETIFSQSKEMTYK